jgi:hypothetical protein
MKLELINTRVRIDGTGSYYKEWQPFAVTCKVSRKTVPSPTDLSRNTYSILSSSENKIKAKETAADEALHLVETIKGELLPEWNYADYLKNASFVRGRN